MEELKEKFKFDWKRAVLTSAYVLAAALVVGGTTWYVMEQNARDVEEANDKSVAELQEQIDSLNIKLKNTSTNDNQPNGSEANNAVTSKKYSNTNPNFSFEYASTLTANKDKNGTVWLSTDGVRANTTLQITYEPSKSIDPKLYFESLVTNGTAIQPYTVNGYGLVGNYRAYQVDYNHQGNVSSVFYVYNNGYVYTISFPGNQQEQYMSILKTFLLS